VPVSQAGDDTSPKTLYNVAEKTVNVRVHKAVDAEIAKLLEEDESEFGSDIEDLEEDFVVQANLAEDSERCVIYVEKSLSSVSMPQEEELAESDAMTLDGVLSQAPSHSILELDQGFSDKPRVQRLLDKQFDLVSVTDKLQISFCYLIYKCVPNNIYPFVVKERFAIFTRTKLC